ncbi:hypothetical protein [Silvibacterium sp.]|uniref:hypothetical protein n=1 Tax=Silvibacterium sp. TaxID=1964179 RepID=UPI0039E5E98B
MSRLLERLMRLRLLLEDAARAELAVRAGALHAAEQAEEYARKEKQSLETRALAPLRGRGEEEKEHGETRFLLLNAASMAEPELEFLELRVRETAAMMEAARDQYLARRRERLQAEILLHAAKEVASRERERSEQRSLDDSFVMARWRHLERDISGPDF